VHVQLGRDPIFAFVNAVTEGHMADDVAVDVLQEIKTKYSSLCDNFLATPAQFWKFVDAFSPILTGAAIEPRSIGAPGGCGLWFGGCVRVCGCGGRAG
jgi:hypothetical protein